jgi:class 3 adenylate cyclase
MNSPNNPIVERRLAAIVVADVVGYTRLMERDDTGTFARLRSIRDEVVDPAVVSHGGRIVKTAGDGLMAEFASAVAALRAAVQIQREMAARNAGTAADERIDYRIGINLGDIMIDGSDVAGDGVNIAARLETLAEPGGICVSGSVREQVHGNLDVGFDDIGEQRVKYIERPIGVYRVALGRDATQTSPSTTSGPRKLMSHWRRWVAGLAVLVAISLGTWLLAPLWKPAPAPAPPALSLAILPFAAPSGSPADEQFADALTQDLTTALGQWGGAKVAVHALVAHYKSGAVDIRTLGRNLNVRYVVEGEVRRVAEAPARLHDRVISLHV